MYSTREQGSRPVPPTGWPDRYRHISTTVSVRAESFQPPIHQQMGNTISVTDSRKVVMSETEEKMSSNGFKLHTTTALGSVMAFSIVAMLIALIVSCATGCLGRTLFTCRAWWTRWRGLRQPSCDSCEAKETLCGATHLRYNKSDKNTCDKQRLHNKNIVDNNGDKKYMHSILLNLICDVDIDGPA